MKQSPIKTLLSATAALMISLTPGAASAHGHHHHYHGCGHKVVVVKHRPRADVVIVRNRLGCRYYSGYGYHPVRNFAHAAVDLLWWESRH